MTVPTGAALQDDVRLEVTDAASADQTREHVKIGHRFVFADGGVAAAPTGRRARLLGYKHNDARQVLPLHEPVELPGLRVIPPGLDDAPLACLVADRDLYRAEMDTVHLYIAAPSRPTGLHLEILYQGQPFTDRALDEDEGLREHGACIEHLAMLSTGEYSARLLQGARALTAPVKFTVADYKLAPMSAKLARHSLDRGRNELSFVLGVESYQRPFDRALEVELLDGEQVCWRGGLSPSAPGRYEGVAPLQGAGPFRLRLTASDDAERSAEVVIPGTRVHERQPTVISELGQEVLFSLMPEPGSLPVRGAHLTEGDFLGTPLVLDDLVTTHGKIQVREAVESLVSITHDLVSGAVTVARHGDQRPGGVVEVEAPSAMSAVYFGCFIDGRPFEAYTHLMRPESVGLSLDVPSEVRPGGEVAIRLSAPADRVRRVLLSVRDRRLTQADKPQAALNSTLKRAVDRAVAGFDSEFSWLDLADRGTWSRLGGAAPAPASFGQLEVSNRFEVRIDDGKGEIRTEVFQQNEITIGRVQGNDIVCPRGNVSKRHSRVVLRDGKLIIVDLRSTNGTFVNNRKLNAPQVLRTGDRVLVGEFTMTFSDVSDIDKSGGFRGGAPSAPRAAPTGAYERDAVLRAARDLESALDSDTGEHLLSMDLDADEMDQELADMDMGMVEEADGFSDFDDSLALDDASSEGESLAASPAAAPQRAQGLQLQQARAPEPDVRRAFPEVLFYGIVEVSGETTVTLPVGDQLGTFAVEAFSVAPGDWVEAEATLVVDQPVRADLRLPTAVFDGDQVTGRLRAFSASGRAKVTLEKNDEPVPMRLGEQPVEAGSIISSPADLSFAAAPGRYVATVEDPDSSEVDVVEIWVDEPRSATSMVREVRFLRAGQSLSLDDADALSLRVLPGIDAPFGALVKATAGYEHLCCEQTASKIVSAIAMYLSSESPVEKARAEDIIISGVAREAQMVVPGGFSMYPGYGGADTYYGPMTPSRLWQLQELRGVPGVSASLRRAVERGIDMADEGARAYGIARIPERATTCEEAYRVAAATGDKRGKELLALVRKRVKLDNGVPVAREPRDRVCDRAELAYAAATLFALGHIAAAMKVADHVLRQLNAQGRLYSTVDSVAAIALLSQLRKSGALGDAALVVSGEPMRVSLAVERSDQVEHVEVKEGVCALEVTRLVTEDWRELKAKFPVRVGFRDAAGQKTKRFKAGDRAELLVELPEGYVVGDLLHVVLPPALVWLKGGGQVQRFSVDFAGRDEVRVPVVCAHAIEAQQHFAICVRNMFKEERASCPGLLRVMG